MTKTEWIYKTNPDNSCRYILGTQGHHPLFCIGINPSTAAPEDLDQTLNSVQNIALNNGYDSWIMLNVYPKRSTDFNLLDQVKNTSLHNENLKEIVDLISDYSNLDIWCAWGNHILDRPYLPSCLKDLYQILNRHPNISWLSIGMNKNGTPKHPLYNSSKTALIPFDMNFYVSKFL